MADVNFEVQTISGTLPQAKKEQKILLSVCSSTECHWCRWMDINVYKDQALANKINNQMVAIKPLASMNRLEFNQYCKALPTMLFFDENGKLLRKEVGKKTLTEMTNIVNEVLSSNCTRLDEKLDEGSGTRKGTVCCEGLVKKEQEDNNICVKQACVETSNNYLKFQGLVKDSLPCCDDSAVKYVEQKLGGGNAKRFGLEFVNEYRITCRDQASSKEINKNKRILGKDNAPVKNGNVKKSSGNSVNAH